MAAASAFNQNQVNGFEILTWHIPDFSFIEEHSLESNDYDENQQTSKRQQQQAYLALRCSSRTTTASERKKRRVHLTEYTPLLQIGAGN